MLTESLIPNQFLERAARHPSRPAYADITERADGSLRWDLTNWEHYADRVRRVARAFIALDVAPGDRIAILGSNRSEWTIADLAAMMVGAVPLGIYPTCPAEQVQYLLSHSGASVAIVENATQLDKVLAVRSRVDALRHVILMGEGDTDDDSVAWSELDSLADTVDEEEPDRRRFQVSESDLATLVYTSGTTGPPKAVMLSHGNLVATTRMGLEALTRQSPDDSVLSYLPLAHVAERGISVLGPAVAGYCVYFCPRMELVPLALRAVRPTIFLGVPRVWEKMQAAILSKAGSKPRSQRLFNWATSSQDDGIRNLIADRLLLRRIRSALGLDRAHTVVCGGAPIDDQVLEFFARLGIPIRKIYGLSECAGPATFNRPGDDVAGNVGRPFTGCEIKIADDGEVLIRGDHVFKGYLDDAAATRAALNGKWLHSGDLGVLSQDGSLTIQGRKKDVIITSGGKNVAPHPIEHSLTRHAAIAEVVVIGEGRPYLTALVSTEPDVAVDGLRDSIRRHVDAVNENLSRAEQIKKFTIVSEPFSVDGGELTPTRKLRRSSIAQKYAAEIENMYASSEVAANRVK